jgi:hypothetical protein
MTLIVLFHARAYRNFKSYYTEHVLKHLTGEFPHLVSYNRFVELMIAAMIPLCCGDEEGAVFRHLLYRLHLA